MTAVKITDLTMNTTEPKVLPRVWETIKCLGITKKGTPCNNKRTMVRNCDYKGVCKKHLSQMPKLNPRQKNPTELPENVFKLLPFELWLEIFEFIPKKKCIVLSPINGIISNGTTKDGWQCQSCGEKYIKKKSSSICRI